MITIQKLKKLQKIISIGAVCEEAGIPPGNIHQRMRLNSELRVNEAAAIMKVLEKYIKIIKED